MLNIDSFTLNKIAGAVLGSLLLAFGLGTLADVIYHAETPEKPGMMVEVAEAATGTGEAAAEEAVPLGKLLASASADAGQSAAKACAACHTFDKGGANKVGPNLWGIIDRPIGGHEGFAFSEALSGKSSEAWSIESLNAFLLKPKEFAPGTKMTYGGLKNDTKRADLLAYLNSLSDSPKPLPAE